MSETIASDTRIVVVRIAIPLSHSENALHEMEENARTIAEMGWGRFVSAQVEKPTIDDFKILMEKTTERLSG